MTVLRKTVINADAMLFSELFHQGSFAVPWHQRYYDWGVSDVKVLLRDLDEALREERHCYFLGAIILVEMADRKWAINDGQQRMVTVSLICAALCRRFSQDTKDSQREGHALRMLFDLDASGVWKMDNVEDYKPRIKPPRSDKMRYRQMIRGNSIGTNGKLTAAWKEIENFLGLKNTGGWWERYFDFIREKLEVVCLKIPGDIDSNAVYETINCRGKQLDDLDLIRNFIYSHFNDETESQRKRSINENLEKIREIFPNSQKASEYMRCCLQCRFGFLHKNDFYRDVRAAIREQRGRASKAKIEATDYVFALAREITSPADIELFRMLTSPAPDPKLIDAFKVASSTTRSPRTLTIFLRELRDYKVAQPLMFALMLKYVRETDGRSRPRVAKLINKNLSRLATFVLRTAFVAPKFEPSLFEMEFSNFAMRIATDDGILDGEFCEFLKECDRSRYRVLDDNRFVEAMSEMELHGKRKIKSFLLGVNRAQQGPGATILNEAQCSIEHILPVSPEHNGKWRDFQSVDVEDWVHRVGNLTLISAIDNKPGTKYNLSFSRKRASYRDSSIAITRNLARLDDWTPAAIEKRQRKMAKQAARVWIFT